MIKKTKQKVSNGRNLSWKATASQSHLGKALRGRTGGRARLATAFGLPQCLPGGYRRARGLRHAPAWRLVMAPPAVLDYVVVHELGHLAEPHHSAKFWLIVRSHCPEFMRHKTWLRDHQSLLMQAVAPHP